MSFFTKEEIPINNQINRATCARCGLSSKCENPKIEMSGEGGKGIFILTDHPSKADDESGQHFSGESGKYFEKLLAKLNIKLFKDCYVDYAVRCAPPKSGVTSLHIEACRSKVWENIEKTKPKLIILLGESALECFLGLRHDGSIGDINLWRGFCIPDRDVQAWALPTYSVRFVTQNKKHPVLKKIFNDDIKYALTHINKALPKYSDEEKYIRIINDEESQIEWMRTLYDKAINSDDNLLLALDYETTGLKPHDPVHKIACVSFCYTEDEAVSMMVEGMSDKSKRWLKKILTCSKIVKIAHNIKYEAAWTLNILGYPLYPIGYCSMQAAHVIDNRPGITGLKFQAYVHFGLLGYDKEIEPFLKSEGGGNSVNSVFKAPRVMLQIYNGIDSLVQFRLVLKQMEETSYVPLS